MKKQPAPSTILKWYRLAMKGCADPGYGGCIGPCNSCKAKAKLKAIGRWPNPKQ